MQAEEAGGGLSLTDKLGAKQSNNSMEIKEILEQGLASLPQGYQEVFLLHTIEGFTHQEVSQILRMNPATVRTHYHRAKMMLKEKIGPLLYDGREK